MEFSSMTPVLCDLRRGFIFLMSPGLSFLICEIGATGGESLCVVLFGTCCLARGWGWGAQEMKGEGLSERRGVCTPRRSRGLV